MKIPLTKYGWPQVFILPAVVITVMILLLLAGDNFLSYGSVILTEMVLAVILLFVLAFFRDPDRTSPQDEKILLAPADGRITDIEVVQENGFIGGPVLRIGIFLNIFNAHLNRAPCDVTVEQIEYKKGKYKDARNPMAGKVNESNDLKLVRTSQPGDKLIVRQISGAIARRIVCKAKTGQRLVSGERFGMIKFGSRTELYLPFREEAKCMVKVGDKVKAGLSILVRYE